MFGTYNRLRLHVSATDREVIRAAQRKLKKTSRYSRSARDARHGFYREMLRIHHAERDMVARFRF